MEDYSILQREVIERIGISAGQIVLDCGTGPEASFAICLAETVGADGFVIAIDYEREYVPSIKSSIAHAKARIAFLLSDLRYIPLRSNSVDAATSLDAIQNMASESVVQEAIKEMYRVVKPQGKVTVGSRLPLLKNKAQEVCLQLHRFEFELEHIMWGLQQRFYDKEELVKMLERSGLRDISTNIIERKITYTKNALSKQLKRIKRYVNSIKPETLRKRLKAKYAWLRKEATKFGEEFPPTILTTGIKIAYLKMNIFPKYPSVEN